MRMLCRCGSIVEFKVRELLVAKPSMESLDDNFTDTQIDEDFAKLSLKFAMEAPHSLIEQVYIYMHASNNIRTRLLQKLARMMVKIDKWSDL